MEALILKERRLHRTWGKAKRVRPLYAIFCQRGRSTAWEHGGSFGVWGSALYCDEVERKRKTGEIISP